MDPSESCLRTNECLFLDFSLGDALPTILVSIDLDPSEIVHAIIVVCTLSSSTAHLITYRSATINADVQIEKYGIANAQEASIS